MPRRVTMLTTLITLAGCSSAVDPGTKGAELRLLHATPDLGPVTVQVDGAPVISDVTFGQSSPIVEVSGGPVTVDVRQGSTLLGTLHPTLTLDHLNTIVVAGGVPQLSSVVVPDTGQAENDRANLRMVNVVGPTTVTSTPLDVKVKAPNNQNPDSVLTFGMDAAVARYGSLMYFDPGTFTFTYYAHGTSTPVLAEVTFQVSAGQVKAVILERLADGNYQVQVVEEH